MASNYEFFTVQSAKIVKGEKFGYLTAVLYLAAADLAHTTLQKLLQWGSEAEIKHAAHILRLNGSWLSAATTARLVLLDALSQVAGINMCPWKTDGCSFVCLGHASGRFAMIKAGNVTNNAILAQIRRTLAFLQNRDRFITGAIRDLGKFEREAKRWRMKPAARLNGTSDLRFDKFARAIFDSFPAMKFYDYSKDPIKLRDYVEGRTPANYHLTFSYGETVAHSALLTAFRNGVNVAVAFKGSKDEYARVTSFQRATGLDPVDLELIDGDKHDLRFLDRSTGAIVALNAKGRAKRDTSGFVIDAGVAA